MATTHSTVVVAETATATTTGVAVTTTEVPPVASDLASIEMLAQEQSQTAASLSTQMTAQLARLEKDTEALTAQNTILSQTNAALSAELAAAETHSQELAESRAAVTAIKAKLAALQENAQHNYVAASKIAAQKKALIADLTAVKRGDAAVILDLSRKAEALQTDVVIKTKELEVDRVYIAELEEKASSLAADKKKLSGVAGQLVATRDGVVAKNEELKTGIFELDAANETLKAKLWRTQAAMVALAEQKTTLLAALEAEKEHVDMVVTQQTEVEAARADAEAKLAQVATTKGALEELLAETLADNRTLAGRIKSLEGEVASLRAALAAEQDKAAIFSELQTQKEEAEARVAALQAEAAQTAALHLEQLAMERSKAAALTASIETDVVRAISKTRTVTAEANGMVTVETTPGQSTHVGVEVTARER